MENANWISALIAALSGGIGGVLVSLFVQDIREKKSTTLAIYQEFHSVAFDPIRKSAYMDITREDTIQKANCSYNKNEAFFEGFAHKHDEVRQVMHFLNRIVVLYRNGHFNNALLRDLLGLQLTEWYNAFEPYVLKEPRSSGLREFLDNMKLLSKIGTKSRF